MIALVFRIKKLRSCVASLIGWGKSLPKGWAHKRWQCVGKMTKGSVWPRVGQKPRACTSTESITFKLLQKRCTCHIWWGLIDFYKDEKRWGWADTRSKAEMITESFLSSNRARLGSTPSAIWYGKRQVQSLRPELKMQKESDNQRESSSLHRYQQQPATSTLGEWAPECPLASRG